MILLIGILISDHLATVDQDAPADLTPWASQSQDSINPGRAASVPETDWQRPSQLRPIREAPLPTPQELERQPVASPPASHELAPAGDPTELPVAAGVERQEPNHSQQTAPPHQARQEQQPAPEHTVQSFDLTHAAGQSDPRPDLYRGDETESAPEPEPTRTAARPGEQVHYVRPDETLYDIARKYYGNGEYWRSLAEYNSGKVRPNGQVNENVRLLIPQKTALGIPEGFEPVAGEPGRRPASEAEPTGSTPREVEARKGDTLSKLAARHLGSAGKWRELLEANSDRLDRPEELRAGMTLRLPASAGGQRQEAERRQAPSRPASATESYTVQRNDNLYKISQQMLGDGGRWEEIYKLNRDRLDSPQALKVGQKLRLPG
ncbi:MAG: LysM peptidoglycan-binding domain-containing protein [Phycisphaeraceae bacterium]